MDTPPNHEDLKTPAQLARKYPVSRSGIYSACKDGLLAFYRLPSRRGKRGKYLIREADFLVWLESNRHEADQVEEVDVLDEEDLKIIR